MVALSPPPISTASHFAELSNVVVTSTAATGSTPTTTSVMQPLVINLGDVVDSVVVSSAGSPLSTVVNLAVAQELRRPESPSKVRHCDVFRVLYSSLSLDLPKNVDNLFLE
jgi:hypothetical protein